MKRHILKTLLKQNYGKLIVIFLLAFSAAFLNAYPLKLLKQLIDDTADSFIMESRIVEIKRILMLAIVYLGCQLVNNIVTNYLVFYTQKAKVKIADGLRKDCFKQLLQSGQGFFDNTNSSEILGIVMQDTDITAQGIIYPFCNFLKAVFNFGFALLFMFQINSYLTFIIIPIAIAIGVITSISGGKFKLLAKTNRRRNNEMWNCCQEGIVGMREIHALSQENNKLTEFSKKSEGMIDNEMSTAGYKLKVDSINSFCYVIVIAVMVLFGGWLVYVGKATLGTIVSIFTYNNLLSAPIQSFILVFQDANKVSASLERIEKIKLCAIEETIEGSIESDRFNEETMISFNDVTFKYMNAEKAVLKGVSFNLLKGKTYGFVGSTGCGKSTILKLCNGLYPVSEGEILIGGIPISLETKHGLRQKISCAFQDTFLFNRTIKENILMANPAASEEELMKVVKVACVDDIVKRLPKGLDSVVGENGVLLSGGERQRIGVARALLKNADILLLDEATSALDNNTEKTMVNNIQNSYSNITCLTVAHRLSTIENADCIFVLSDGKIVESGTHENLISAQGMYKKMYEAYKLVEDSEHMKVEDRSYGETVC